MKSRIWYACVIAMLVVSTVGFGEIVCDDDDGNWYGDTGGVGDVSGGARESTATALVEGDNCYGYGYGEGWMWIYTTEYEWCDYSYYVYVYAEAHLWLWDGQLSYAAGYAYAEGQSSQAYDPPPPSIVTKNPSVLDSGYDGEWVYDNDEGYSADYVCVSTGEYFTPNTGISSEHTACALAEVGEGDENIAFSHVCARAWGTLSVH